MNWYALYTKPRWEKKVFQRLRENEVLAYCPLQKTRKKWSDRVKLVEEPLFKGYVFAKIEDTDITKVRMINGVVNLVYWNGKPAKIRDEEVVEIQRFLNDYEDVQCINLNLDKGSRVMIKKGLLMNQIAIVRKLMGQHVEVLIESLGCKLVAKIPKSNVSGV